MKSKTTGKFWQLYARLLVDIQRRTYKAYQLWSENSNHPSLHFKRVDESDPLYSVRVSDSYRVLGILDNDTMIWFWIGTHDEYERMLR